MNDRPPLAPAPRFVALAESGHATLDLRLPRDASGLSAWKRREPWFPDGPATEWRDVYRTWFGDRELPLVNLHLMGAAPPDWDDKVRRPMATQQFASPGTFRYRLRAAKFVLRMCVHTIGFGEGRAVRRFVTHLLFPTGSGA